MAIAAGVVGIISLRIRLLSWLVIPLLSLILIARIFLSVWVAAKGMCGGVWQERQLKAACNVVTGELVEAVVVWVVEVGVYAWKWNIGRDREEKSGLHEREGLIPEQATRPEGVYQRSSLRRWKGGDE